MHHASGRLQFLGRLFSGKSLGSWLDQRVADLRSAVQDWNLDELMVTADAVIAEYLVNQYSVDCPVLHRDQVEQLPGYTKPNPLQAALGLAAYHKVVIAVPFDGDHDVFKFSVGQCREVVKGMVYENELQFGDGQAVDVIEPTNLRQYFNVELDLIEECLASAREIISRHNVALVGAATEQLAQRRALIAGVGFPIRQRPDAKNYTVPVRRRKIAVPPPAISASPIRPEPSLVDAQYEDALRVLVNMRNAFERSPSTTEQLTENGIRDLLLVALNAQFEGDAVGEVFNGEGKTDILIRSDDRNVFIAECKIWRGRRTATEALDQLLGYLVWRDTKAALLLFIRDADATAVTREALAQIKAHPNYKRPGKITSNDRHDVVVHANGDPDREIHLAFLPFLIARRRRPPTT